MYSATQLIEGITRPMRSLIESYSLVRRTTSGTRGVNVMSRDWDNLIILDACRYDVFADLNTIPGDLTSIQSVGSQTGEFVRKTFGGKSHPDTVYALSKPNPLNVDARFYKVVNLWRNEWGSDLQTIPNEVMVEKSLEIDGEYPNKRLIIHFNPPHLPFIGEDGRRIHEEYGRDIQTLWNLTREGEISVERMWEAYRENLEVTLPYVESLVERLKGKTVITSDHGQAFGEWDVYSHPSGIYLDELRQVPWLELEGDERKSISDGDAVDEFMDYSTADVEERLSMLGYR